MNTVDALQGLNPAQRNAVQAVQGPVLVLAGPGSGKTRVIVHRIAYLITACGVQPYSILAVTFTNKAAREMAERLHQLLGSAADELCVGTFHAICAGVLRRDGMAVGLNPRYSIYDDSDQISLIKRSLQELGLDPKTYSPRALRSAIGAAKSQLLTADDYAGLTQSYFEEIVSRVYQRYEVLLAQNQAADFDDLLLKTHHLLQSHPQILARYQSRWLHVLVDEFQDTNLTQYALARQLSAGHSNICVVGDPDQSIYSWRQADIRNILNFERDYPAAQVVHLEQNYRSTQTILEAAHSVVCVNEERKENWLWTENEKGLPVITVEAGSESEEAQFVLREVASLLVQGDVRPNDCAVMYRTNAQSRALEEAFMRHGTPYQTVGGVRFYDRREIKDLIAYLRLIHNPYDDISLLRIVNTPPRGIGQRTLDEFRAWAGQTGIPLYAALQRLTEDGFASPFGVQASAALARFASLIRDLVAQSTQVDVGRLLDSVVKMSGYQDYAMESPDGEERWQNILELRGIAGAYRDMDPQQGLASFLEGVGLFSDTDELDEEKEGVTLITLHQAKGLEFPIVFMVGMEEGLLPHFKCFDDRAQMQEERRLCYVGMTRARKRLYLLRAVRRTLMGGVTANPPSRFLRDIPKHLTRHASLYGDEGMLMPCGAATVMEFQVGDRVQHSRFGQGVVVGCSQARDDCELEVAFSEFGTKKLLSSLARLQRLQDD
jgi:DNA helicase-2/ATP-dependent DNA helicase PcrA